MEETLNLDYYRSLDDILSPHIDKLSDIYLYLFPINNEEEKDKFFKSKFKINPKFKYPEIIDFSPKQLKAELNNISILGDEYFSSIYRDLIKELTYITDLLIQRDSNDFIHTSNLCYGEFSSELISVANDWISKYANNFEDIDNLKKPLTSMDVKKKFNEELQKFNINSWVAEIKDYPNLAIDEVTKEIYIPKGVNFTEEELNSGICHELYGHVFRSENGLLQPLPKLFSNVFPFGLPIEEGIACYNEREFLSNIDRTAFASNVLGPYSVLKGDSFSQTFEMMMSFGYNLDTAWKRTLRAHRGGGFTKDKVYLDGFLQIKNFISEGGNLTDLYCGCIRIPDIDPIKKLINEGILVKPKYLPLNL